MQNFSFKKIIFPAVAIVAVFVVGYLIYQKISVSKNTPTSFTGGLSSLTTGTAGINTSRTATSNQIVELLKNMSQITLPTELLSQSEFVQLTDGTVVLPARLDTGRRNPFGTVINPSGTVSDGLIIPTTQTVTSTILDVPVTTTVTTKPATTTTTSKNTTTTTKK